MGPVLLTLLTQPVVQPVTFIPPSLGWGQRVITDTRREKGGLAPCVFQL